MANEIPKMRRILESNAGREFVRRILEPGAGPKPIRNEDGSVSTHRMSAEVDASGRWYVYPTIVNRNGNLVQLDPEGGIESEAGRNALETGEFISFGGDRDAAIAFSKNYKQAAEELTAFSEDLTRDFEE